MATIEPIQPDDSNFARSWEEMQDYILSAYAVPRGYVNGVRTADVTYASLYAAAEQMNRIRQEHLARAALPTLVLSTDWTEMRSMLTEREWWTSDDPEAMYRCVDPTLTRMWHRGAPHPWEAWSPRRQALLADAYRRTTGLAWPERIGDSAYLVGVIACALMREIFGNPFAPAAVGDWLTPQVRQVAADVASRNAFAEYPVLVDLLLEAGCPEVVPCPACDGKGYYYPHNPIQPRACPACRGAGTAPGPLLQHLRGVERCWLCVRTGSDPAKDACSVCGQLGAVGPFDRPCAPGWVPLRSPHVRGCWALDLLAGADPNDVDT